MGHNVQSSHNRVFLLQLQILPALWNPLLSHLLGFSTLLPLQPALYTCGGSLCRRPQTLHAQILHRPSIQAAFDNHKLKIPRTLRTEQAQAKTIVKARVPPSKHSLWSEFFLCKGYWFIPKDMANIFSCLWRLLSHFILFKEKNKNLAFITVLTLIQATEQREKHAEDRRNIWNHVNHQQIQKISLAAGKVTGQALWATTIHHALQPVPRSQG